MRKRVVGREGIETDDSNFTIENNTVIENWDDGIDRVFSSFFSVFPIHF